MDIEHCTSGNDKKKKERCTAPSPANDCSPGDIVTNICGTDVLFGRGAMIDRNVGNVHFRSLVRQYKAQYSTCRNRETKHRVAEEIYDTIQIRNGRFLRKIADTDVKNSKTMSKQDEKSDKIDSTWIVVEVHDALAKIKQALRERSETEDLTGFKLEHGTTPEGKSVSSNDTMTTCTVSPRKENLQNTEPCRDSEALEPSNAIVGMQTSNVYSDQQTLEEGTSLLQLQHQIQQRQRIIELQERLRTQELLRTQEQHRRQQMLLQLEITRLQGEVEFERLRQTAIRPTLDEFGILPRLNMLQQQQQQQQLQQLQQTNTTAGPFGGFEAPLVSFFPTLSISNSSQQRGLSTELINNLLLSRACVGGANANPMFATTRNHIETDPVTLHPSMRFYNYLQQQKSNSNGIASNDHCNGQYINSAVNKIEPTNESSRKRCRHYDDDDAELRMKMGGERKHN